MVVLLDGALGISAYKNMNPFKTPSCNQKNHHLHNLEGKVQLQVILDDLFFIHEVLTLVITIKIIISLIGTTM